jgi:hypothetical protein
MQSGCEQQQRKSGRPTGSVHGYVQVARTHWRLARAAIIGALNQADDGMSKTWRR